MNKFTASEYKLFEQLVGLSQPALKKAMAKFLKKYYAGDIFETKEFIICEGDIPIALVAHMDTVFSTPASDVFYDTRKNVIWSPQGLGADDRAGVFAILRIVQSGLRPHIILTTDEEKGCLGAEKLGELQKPFEDLRYLIELDRRGANDCVFYDCDNQEFTDYVSSFGFVEEFGTFSDICSLCEPWGIAGVNLSVGYKNEHSVSETLHVGHLLSTIEKVKVMLQQPLDNIPTFKFIPSPYSYANWLTATGFDSEREDYSGCGITMSCSCCKRHFMWEELIPVWSKEGYTQFRCSDCIVGATWCESCGDAFEDSTKTKCPKCEKEKVTNGNH